MLYLLPTARSENFKSSYNKTTNITYITNRTWLFGLYTVYGLGLKPSFRFVVVVKRRAYNRRK